MLLLLLTIGGALQSQGESKPTPLNQDQWVLGTDYPAEAIKAREEGAVGVKLGVDAAGRVSSCTITRSANSATLDATSCKLLTERARFSPARGEAGKAIASTYELSFKWVIPEDIDKLGELVATLDLHPDGRVASCSSEISGQIHDLAKADFCSNFSDSNESEFLAKQGATCRIIRIVFALSMNEAGYPRDESRWGALLTKQVGEFRVSKKSEEPISCVIKSVWGEDLGKNICNSFDTYPKKAAPPAQAPVHAIRLELAVFGTPR